MRRGDRPAALRFASRRWGDWTEIRVTAQLIRASDDFHLWSKTYDAPAADILKVQTDVAESIASALNVVLDDDARQAMASSPGRSLA